MFDPKNLEKLAPSGGTYLTNLTKNMHALEYLSQLQKERLKFVLKGGTAVQLMIPSGWQRVSIDIDLVTTTTRKEIESTLQEICENFGNEYYAWRTRRQNVSVNIPFHSYRIEVPLSSGQPSVILLDVMLYQTELPLAKIGVNSFFYESQTSVTTLSTNAIFADKLSILGPKTIGRNLIDSRNGLEYGKHLYDLKNLLPFVRDIKIVLKAYDIILKQQNQIRGTNHSLNNVLADLIYVCKVLNLTHDTIDHCLSNYTAPDLDIIQDHFRILDRGIITRFIGFLPPRQAFLWTDVRETAAIIALITKLLRSVSESEITLKQANKILEIIKGDFTQEAKRYIKNAMDVLRKVPQHECWHLDLEEASELPTVLVCWAGYYNPSIFKI